MARIIPFSRHATQGIIMSIDYKILSANLTANGIAAVGNLFAAARHTH
jgi:hypothetical protein